MHCSDYAEWIARKLDGLLPADCLQELETHLSGCSRCRAELLLQQRIRDALTEEVPSGLSADFTRRVSEKVLETARVEKRAQRWADVIPALAFVSGAVLLFLLRADLARVLPPLMEGLTDAAAAPVAWVGDALLGILTRAVHFPSEHIPALERLSKPLMMTLAATLLGVIPVFWAFYRIFGFLRD